MNQKEGNLEIKTKGLIKSSWKSFYCVLNETKFCWFKSESEVEEGKEVGKVILTPKHTVQKVSIPDKFCTFVLEGEKKPLEFEAPNKKEQDSWIDALNKAISKAQV